MEEGRDPKALDHGRKNYNKEKRRRTRVREESKRKKNLICSQDVLKRIKEIDPSVADPEEYVRYFIVDESSMISVIDIPNGTSGM